MSKLEIAADALDRPRAIVVGCGRLGKRHLQGLVGMPTSIDITAVDVSQNALDSCRQFCAGLPNVERHNLCFKNLEQFLQCKHEKFDLCIIASTANGRLDLATELTASFEANFWILEKPVEQSVSRMLRFKDIFEFGSCFVNFARRQMSFYQAIQNRLSPAGTLEVIASHSTFNIASNISHFIDLVHWWTGALPNSVNVLGLEPRWFSSQREGFFEVNGTILVRFDDGSSLQITSGNAATNNPINVKTNTGCVYEIDETTGVFRSENGEEIVGSMELQSTMSTDIFALILTNKSCLLTPLHTAIDCNLMLTDVLLSHWNEYGALRHINDTLPVT